MGYKLSTFTLENIMPHSSDDDGLENQGAGFMESLGGIRKLSSDKVDLTRDRPIKSRQANQTQPSIGDPKIATAASHHGTGSVPESWFHQGIQKNLKRKIQLGQFPVEVELDLHGYRQHEALQELANFIQLAIQQHIRFLVIIHGKGYRSKNESVLRPLVQNWLSQQPNVLAYCPAQPRDGGSGASYVYLRKA